jgi:hypothetical protein
MKQSEFTTSHHPSTSAVREGGFLIFSHHHHRFHLVVLKLVEELLEEFWILNVCVIAEDSNGVLSLITILPFSHGNWATHKA